MGRILVIRGGALGDFILTLPALAAVRARFPDVRLEVLGYPHLAGLALFGGLADAIHPIEARALAGFFARGAPLDAAMSKFFSDFDLILSYLYDPDEVFRENVARCTPAQFIVGPHRPDERGRLHAIDTFLVPLERLAIFDRNLAPRLDPVPVPPGPGRWLAAHPGSGSEAKNWPERRWVQLLTHVIEGSDRRILLVGGEAEGTRLDRVQAELPAGRVRLARSLPLPELAGLLRGCSEFVGHDSGITHLAAALGLPCVALWGPSNADIWRPRGEHIVLVRDDDGLSGLEADVVWKVLHPKLVSADRSGRPWPPPPASAPA